MSAGEHRGVYGICLVCGHQLDGHDFRGLTTRVKVRCSACPDGVCDLRTARRSRDG